MSSYPDLKIRSYWPRWLLLAFFVFFAFQSIIIALAFKGSAFILLAPGLVCAIKAVETWRELRKHLEEAGKAGSPRQT